MNCKLNPPRDPSPSVPAKNAGPSPSPDSLVSMPQNSKLIIKNWWTNSGVTTTLTQPPKNGPRKTLILRANHSSVPSSNLLWTPSANSALQSWKATMNSWTKSWPHSTLPSLKLIRNSPANTFWRQSCPNGSMPLTHYLKWWLFIFPHQELHKNTEPPIFTKDPRTILPPPPWEPATPKDQLWCTSLRWCPPPIKVDSLPSAESSLEPSPQDKKSESSDQTTNQAKRKIYMKNLSKEPYLWWEEPLSIFLMYPAETPSDWSELINTWWKPVPSPLKRLLAPSETWNTVSHQSSELP